MTDLSRLELNLPTVSEMVRLLGTNDKYLKLLSSLYGVEMYAGNNQILADTHDPAMLAEMARLFMILKSMAHRNVFFNERDIIYLKNLLPKVGDDEILDLFLNRKEIIKNYSGKPIYAKTLNQKKYLASIEKNEIVLGIGPAGTGKTYLAVLVGIRKLRDGDVKQIILTRPAVEAGENLGFLPGDLKEKVDPYLRPLYDALYDILGTKTAQTMIEQGTIEIAPLAYMRGRTLDNAYVILDEAQNTTVNQMKLFLTRLGFGSKMIVTGDVTQSDLPKHVEPGLVIAARILQNVPGIDICHFDKIDVVRHPLVQTILERFEHAQD
ncbi:MAG: phosphate starvation-inducible protein PhoH [Tenericutes bacterium GWF2_57_13]|nr:MAG: phosphate starvation-inducible protein PhoH [Tenericutes bacterium GWF2_57_13]